MLQTSLPVVPKSGGPPSRATSGAEGGFSTPSSTVGSQHRYSRSIDNAVRPEPCPPPERPASISVQSQVNLEETRREAQHTLTMCRHVIASLELTRLRKSRKGIYHWLGFWDRLYERPFSRLLSSRVTSALYKVDALFRAVSTDLHQLTQRMELAIIQASSEKEILHILERMEEEVGLRRRRRRRKAQHILDKMRANIEAIPVKVNDELFDDMKRGVFALDVFCDYHPGDLTAEETESMWPEHFLDQPAGLVAVSPYLYRQWQESALSGASGAYMPLSAYSSNTTWYDAVEHWVNDGNEDNARTPREGI